MQLTEEHLIIRFFHPLKLLLVAALFSLMGMSAMAETVNQGRQQSISAQSKLAHVESKMEKETQVNINQADAEELASVLNGVGLRKAEAIVQYREQNGPFTQIDQLQEVPGIGPSLLERNRARLKI